MTQDKKYGLPTLKKYPMPDAAHVRSAIKFFNYVDSKHEQELADAILARMEEYGLDPSEFNVGDENRFKKYISNSALKHHGIKGMHWGIRRFQNEDGSLTDAGRKRYSLDDAPSRTHMENHMKFTSKNGDTITLEREEDSAFAKTLAKYIPIVRKALHDCSSFTIYANGEYVGDLDLVQKGKKELNTAWISIGEEHQGKGYASAVMRNIVDYAKESGNEKVTLEVPGISPDARHIYEKTGFKAVKQLTTEKDDPMWGGLTAMELDLTTVKNSDQYKLGKRNCMI